MLVCQKILVFFASIGFAANPTANGMWYDTTRGFLGEGIFRGRNLFERNVREECPGGLPGWEISWRKMSGEKCPYPHAGLEVTMCSGYDLCHPS